MIFTLMHGTDTPIPSHVTAGADV